MAELKNLNVALLGFGNVGRALGELLLRKAGTLRDEYGLVVRVVGISTGRHGHAINPAGIPVKAALEAVRSGQPLTPLHHGAPVADTAGFLAATSADLLFETSPTSITDGQPSLSYITAALTKGMHVVTANKGPVAFALRTLRMLAEQKGVGFMHEATVMGGAPVMSLVRESMPAATIRRVRGIFNSTTNYILSSMEQDNVTFEQALHAAQEIGIAETDPTLDIDGWDSAVKTAIVANVFMGASLTPQDVNPVGIRDLALETVQQRAGEGKRIRLICEAVRQPDGTVRASVAPQALPQSDALAQIVGRNNVIDFETDTLHRITLIEHSAGPDTTAYGMFADMLNILRGRHHTAVH
ncbi:MAG: homoserine dehydrogenase [Anaerolineae bacterium]|nr:homoserine dehydrogenase [Anaerolineae bacterium]